MANSTRPSVVVLGSVHMDLIASAERLPSPGESVTGGDFTMTPGGKGGNQACQFALAGARASIISKVGDDMFGREIKTSLTLFGVETARIAVDDHLLTGASVILAGDGDYMSIIAPGAAGAIAEAEIDDAKDEIEQAGALVLQLELPVDISAHAARIASNAGRTVVLNASPAPSSLEAVPRRLWNACSVLIVNRVEANRLLNDSAVNGNHVETVHSLQQRTGVDCVAMTLGADGAIAILGDECVAVDAYETSVVDTVGAGDAFLGIFVAALIGRLPLIDCLRRGCAAGALAVQKRGALGSLPTVRQVEQFMESQYRKPRANGH